jgi:hypothetical protein
MGRVSQNLELFIIDHLGEYDESMCPEKYYESVTDLIWSELINTRVDPYK